MVVVEDLATEEVVAEAVVVEDLETEEEAGVEVAVEEPLEVAEEDEVE